MMMLPLTVFLHRLLHFLDQTVGDASLLYHGTTS